MGGCNGLVSRRKECLERIQYKLCSHVEGETFAFGDQIDDCCQADITPQLFSTGIPAKSYNSKFCYFSLMLTLLHSVAKF